MANTVFKAENGLLVVGSTNITGSLTVGSEFNISGNITFAGTSSCKET
jgi:HKD family nuclease